MCIQTSIQNHIFKKNSFDQFGQKRAHSRNIKCDISFLNCTRWPHNPHHVSARIKKDRKQFQLYSKNRIDHTLFYYHKIVLYYFSILFCQIFLVEKAFTSKYIQCSNVTLFQLKHVKQQFTYFICNRSYCPLASLRPLEIRRQIYVTRNCSELTKRKKERTTITQTKEVSA